jgi:hypothetical protein
MAVAKERVTTEYVVLEQRELTDPQTSETVIAWVESGNADGATRDAVVKQIAGDREGIWRPVPTRNWAEPLRTREHIERSMKVEAVEPF